MISRIIVAAMLLISPILGQSSSIEFYPSTQIHFFSDKVVGTVYGERETANDALPQPQFSCNIIFAGMRISPNHYRLLLWENDFPDNAVEAIATINSEAIVTFQNTPRSLCMNVWGNPLTSPIPAHFVTTHSAVDQSREGWASIAIVRSPRAYFYRTADSGSRLQSYVIFANIIYVLTIDRNYTHAFFVGNGNRTSGYLKTSDLFFPFN